MLIHSMLPLPIAVYADLNKKGNRLLLAGKHPNQVKLACAREMVGFVWESLNQSGRWLAL